MKNHYVILFLFLVFAGCAFPGYTTVKLNTYQDEYTGVKTIETKISFPHTTYQALLIFRNSQKKGVSSSFLVGNFWSKDWKFFRRADILIDGANTSIESYNSRNDILGSSVEEFVHFRLNDEIINNLKICKSLKIRLSGEKGSEEFIFNSEEMTLVKEWIQHFE